MERSPSLKAFLPLIIILVFVGWGGVLSIMTSYEPLVQWRLLFFLLVVFALTGTALPATVHLNLRFTTNPPATARVMVRQALWFGIYGATLAWLMEGRAFSPSLALIFLIGFGAIEVFLRMWERSQWRSPE